MLLIGDNAAELLLTELWLGMQACVYFCCFNSPKQNLISKSKQNVSGFFCLVGWVLFRFVLFCFFLLDLPLRSLLISLLPDILQICAQDAAFWAIQALLLQVRFVSTQCVSTCITISIKIINVITSGLPKHSRWPILSELSHNIAVDFMQYFSL